MHANAFAATAAHAQQSDRVQLCDQVEVEGGYQALLERDTVIRRLHPSALSSPRRRNRFVKELQTLASLHHHNFVRIYDAGLRDEVPYAVFERLHGATAQQRIELLAGRGMTMQPEEAVRIVRGVADGVEYARRCGVRVNNLTPGNITLTDDRRVVLMGLGEPLPDNPLTAPAELIAYASPERLFGGPVEDDSSVYALGVLLAHLVFGRLPFEGNTISILTQKQQSDSLPLLEDARLALLCPYPLATVMHRATTYEPGERYPSVEVFRMALVDTLNGHPYKTQLLRVRGQRLSDAHQPVDERTWVSARTRGPVYEQGGERPAMPEQARMAAPFPSSASSAWIDVAPDAVFTPAHGPARSHADMAPSLAEEGFLAFVTPGPAAEAAAGEAPGEAPGYDPLMPGLTDPALQAALPFTLLVPMPEQNEASAPLTSVVVPQQNFLSAHHLFIAALLTILVVSTAIMFG